MTISLRFASGAPAGSVMHNEHSSTEFPRIGLLVDPVGAYGRGVIRGVLSFARTHGWNVAVERLRHFDQQVEPVSRWDVDGLILQAHHPWMVDDILASGRPCVSIGNLIPDMPFPTVVPDDLAVGALAADYFRGRRFTHFGFFGNMGTGFARLRAQGLRARLQDTSSNDNPFTLSVLAEAGDGVVRQRLIGDWLASLPKPVAVFAASDDLAHMVLVAARSIGAAVPDDIAVLGVDDDELLNLLVTPSLSSIRLPSEPVGSEGMRLMGQLLARQPMPTGPVLVPPSGEIASRQSTDVLAVTDTEVSRALSLIRKEACRPLSVGDVVSEIPIGRRSLERRFHRLLGRSVFGEIQRVRVGHAKRMLTESDAPIAQIASSCGYSDPTRLGIAFRAVTGMTPRDYRKRFRIGQY